VRRRCRGERHRDQAERPRAPQQLGQHGEENGSAVLGPGRVAIVGGRNIGEEYFSAAAEVNFRDLDLLLFGPAVAQASTIFDDYWNSAAAVPIAALGQAKPEALDAVITSIESEAGAAAARPYLDRVEQSQSVRAYHERGLHPHWTQAVQIVADPPLKWQSDDRSGWLVRRLVVIRGRRPRNAAPGGAAQRRDEPPPAGAECIGDGGSLVDQLRTRRDGLPGALVQLEDGRYAVSGSAVIIGGSREVQDSARRKIRQSKSDAERAWWREVVGALAAPED